VSTSCAQKVNQFDENKKRTGVWKKYHSNKRIRYVGKFEKGKEVGIFKHYDIRTSDHPTVIKQFSKVSDSVSVKFFTLNSKLRSEGYMIGKNRVGKWMYYFSNGKLFSEENYINGKLDGDLINYYKNQKITEHSQYKNGVLEGISKKYSDRGILIEEVMFANGKANGKAKYFELNGTIKEEGLYKDGKRVGKWEFYLDGEIASDKEKKEDRKKFKKN
jgi:antitoxin component YwqK of YwqJK toxin-antitoxin module